MVMNLKISAIKTLVYVLGHGQLFRRVVDEVIRVDLAMPEEQGETKKAHVKSELAIILDDLKPIANRIINLLIELALQYLEAKAAQSLG
jgi:hypothetical protein